ncbi:MAG: dihydropteroate synthase [Duncaniella sp.]|nr:dihydropteroate synthase [Duncaniella sp.]
MFQSFTLRLGSELVTIDRPQVMGIVNVTPDSFYTASRNGSEEELSRRVSAMVTDGAHILDIGGYSSRPGAPEVDVEEEWRRVSLGLKVARREAPATMLSVDTFRSEIARRAVEEYGPLIINDISGGSLDSDMWHTVASLGVPYILMHMRGNPATMQSLTDYTDVTAEVIADLSRKLRQLRLIGVADVIVDPGFGFSKTLTQNYELFHHLELFGETLGAPLLVGISRKSMISRLLEIDTAETLAGTVALNTLALSKGAAFLRVHDVREAVQALKVWLAVSRPDILS